MAASSDGWIGVGLDGTLAERSDGPDIGDPIPAMLELVKRWLEEGREVRIVTGRLSLPWGDYREVLGIRERIDRWTEDHLGRRLLSTCVVDDSMAELWDHRARQAP